MVTVSGTNERGTHIGTINSTVRTVVYVSVLFDKSIRVVQIGRRRFF